MNSHRILSLSPNADELGRVHYFGPTDRRRFALVHWPDSAVRGAAVICPPLAYEAVCAHASLRRLAERLAAVGIVGMRIDYDGTSNSVGTERDGARVTAWRQTIVDAVDELRAWGVGPVHLVGLRFGATLASSAADTTAVAGAVWWDPVLAGRRYSRELEMLSGSSQLRPDPTADGIAVAGVRVGAETLAELKQAALRTIDLPCLVIDRSERPAPNSDSDVDTFGPHTERRSLAGTEAMLDTDVELSISPDHILEAITDWIDRRLTSTVTLAVPTMVTTALEHHGDVTLEHRAGRVGASNLMRIETTIVGRQPVCAVVMLNNGLAPNIGPGRSWVELAADIASNGWAAVRVDLSGIGDSPAQPGCAPGEAYPTHAGTDIAEVVADLKANGLQEIALLGLCSGAILAFDGAIARHDINVIVSINGRFDRPFFDDRPFRRLRAARHTNRVIAIPLRKTPLLSWFAKVPTFVWRALDLARIIPDPSHAIRRFITDETTVDSHRVLLISGEHEWGLIALRRRSGRRFRDLIDDPLVTLSVCPDLDHSMFDLEARADVLAQVTSYLSSIWAVTVPPH